MTSRLNQRAASIAAAVGIGVLVVLIVLLWTLAGHGNRPDATATYHRTTDTPQAPGTILPTGTKLKDGDGDDFGERNADTELVRPLKVGPPPLHEHDVLYDRAHDDGAGHTDRTPVRHHSGHFRHRTAEVWDPHPEYEITAFGRTFHLTLAHNDRFVLPHLEVMHVFSNYTQRVRPDIHATGCYYTGKVRGERDSDVTVSLCGGMTGYIRTAEGVFYIEPVDKFQNFTVESTWHRIRRVTHAERKELGSRAGTLGQQTCDVDDVPKYDDTVVNIDKHRIRKRHATSANREYFIEILIVADKKMAEYHRTDDNLIHYILTLMSHVSLLYKDATIGNPISMAVVRIMIMKERNFALATHAYSYDQFDGVNSAEMLKHFCEFQHAVNTDESSHFHHDTALLLTRETICRNTQTRQCDTLGLAELGTMCNPYSSCAIIKDKGLPTSYTIAHELGHVLSMPHDDDHKCTHFHDNAGPHVKHIMSRMMQNDSKPWLWSGCSKHFLTEYLDSMRAHCLLDSPTRDLITNATRRLPGEVFDVDRQCELVYGNGYKICSFMPPCGSLWCANEQGEVEGCRTQHLPWADGTMCNDGRWCHRGLCVRLDRDVLQPVAGGWGVWHHWGPCSRSCGGGVKKSERACNNPRPSNGGQYCIGPSVRYSSCNTDQCQSDRETDFREEQCAAFDGNTRGIPDLSTSVRWVPKYVGILPEEVCKLYCRVRRTSAYYLLSDKVIDGTKCTLNGFDICVNGACRSAGCDNRLDSNRTLDECGVCGGDNSQCEQITGTYNVTKPSYGYNRVTRIPKGSSNIEIRQQSSRNTHKDSAYLALVDSETGEYVLNGDFTVSTSGKIIMYGGVSIEYSGSKVVLERLNSSGSIQLKKDLIIELLSVDRLLPPGVTYTYKIARGGAPQHSWQLLGEWSPCNSICSGTKHIIPRCVRISSGDIVPDDYCANLDLDGARNHQECNTHCRLSWKVKTRKQCSAHCGRGVREVVHQCVRIEVDSIEVKYNLQNLLDPMMDTENIPWAKPVNENHCSSIDKPAAFEPCDGPCGATRWEYDEWSTCTKSCGGGIQTRMSRCIDLDGNDLPDTACKGLNRLQEQSCNLQRCPSWALGDWTPCSVTCGTGYRTKPYYCHLDGQILNPEYCNTDSVPIMRESCTVRKCARWVTSEWSRCSVTCAIGVRTRQVSCQADGNVGVVNDSECLSLIKPNVTKTCSAEMVTCPDFEDNAIVPFFNSRLFEWRSGPWSECSKTCGGGTKSRNVVCQDRSGAQQEDKCDSKRKPVAIVQCALTQCPIWNHGDWSKCNLHCRRYRLVMCQDYNGAAIADARCSAHTRPTNESQCTDGECRPRIAAVHNDSNTDAGHRYQWKMGAWTVCSRLCGRGVKTRHVSCTDTVHNVTLVEQYCKKPAGKKPKTQRPCFRSDCPYVWNEGPWTKCTVSCGEGMMYRNITCHRVTANGHFDPTPVSTSGTNSRLPCDERLKPSHYDRCLVRYCNEAYSWVTGPWKQCTHACGTRGRQIRRLYCHHQGKKVPKKMCARALKPPRKRKCNQKRCNIGEDMSCADVKQRTHSPRDGEYKLLIQGTLLRIYCHRMSSSTPLEYLSLPNEGRENYAEVYDRQLLDPTTCPYNGQRYDDCACAVVNGKHAGLTVFARVRFNITSMRVVPDDYTFARQMKGVQVPYGTAGDCYTRHTNCPQGRFSIDLSGTGVRLGAHVAWVTTGAGASFNLNKQDTKVSGKCGGFCGYCLPDRTVGLQLEVV